MVTKTKPNESESRPNSSAWPREASLCLGSVFVGLNPKTVCTRNSIWNVCPTLILYPSLFCIYLFRFRGAAILRLWFISLSFSVAASKKSENYAVKMFNRRCVDLVIKCCCLLPLGKWHKIRMDFIYTHIYVYVCMCAQCKLSWTQVLYLHNYIFRFI